LKNLWEKVIAKVVAYDRVVMFAVGLRIVEGFLDHDIRALAENPVLVVVINIGITLIYAFDSKVVGELPMLQTGILCHPSRVYGYSGPICVPLSLTVYTSIKGDHRKGLPLSF